MKIKILLILCLNYFLIQCGEVPQVNFMNYTGSTVNSVVGSTEGESILFNFPIVPGSSSVKPQDKYQLSALSSIAIGNCNTKIQSTDDGSCMGNTLPTKYFGFAAGTAYTWIENVGISKSINGTPLLFAQGSRPNFTTNSFDTVNVACATAFPGCRVFTKDRELGESVAESAQASSPFTILNASGDNVNANTIKYNVVWDTLGIRSGPQTTEGAGTKTIAKVLSPYESITPAIIGGVGSVQNWVNAASFATLNPNLAWIDNQGNGISNISVSQSVNGQPLMFVGQYGGDKYHYNLENPGGAKINDKWVIPKKTN
jgi:hypothetical protein